MLLLHLQAKLADFGLHKRVRRMINNNMAVPWTQDATYHGIEYERSFYGGQLYLARSALSDEGSIHGATAAAAAAAAVAAMAAANGDAAPSAASCSGGTLKHSDSAAELASQKEQLRNVVLAKQQGLMGREDFVARVLSSASVGGPDVLQVRCSTCPDMPALTALFPAHTRPPFHPGRATISSACT